jgi:inosine/xanthosine triphosphate pyrophosphatase family protein
MKRAGGAVKPLTFVTGNANKLAEVKAILGDSIPLTSKAIDRTLPPHIASPFF